MIIWVARVYALCFVYRILEEFFPKLKTNAASALIHNITDPIQALVAGIAKDVLPKKESDASLFINIISMFGVLIIARILDFII